MSSVREQQQCVKSQVFRCSGEMTVTGQAGTQVVCDQMKTEVCVTTSSDMFTSNASWHFDSSHQNTYRESYSFEELMHTENSNLCSLPMISVPSTASTFMSDFPLSDDNLLNHVESNLFTTTISSSHQGSQSFVFSSSCQKYSNRIEKTEPPSSLLETPGSLGTGDIPKGTSSSTSPTCTSEIVPESCHLGNPFTIPIQVPASNMQAKRCNSKQLKLDQSAPDAVCTSNLPEYLSVKVKSQSDESVDVSCAMGPTEDTSNTSTIRCQVCGDSAAGFHCGAYVCEACKVSRKLVL